MPETTNKLVWMLWFEDDKKATFAAALERASKYYQHKYGHWPNRVQLPEAWKDEAKALKRRWAQQGRNSIKLEIRPDVLRRHLMVTYSLNEEQTHGKD